MLKEYAGFDRRQRELPCCYLPVVDVALLHEPLLVYDLSVQQNPSFVANTMVMHNCPSGTPEASRAAW